MLSILHEIVYHISMIVRNAVSLESSAILAIPAIPKVHGTQVVGQIGHLHVLFGVVDQSKSFHNYFRIVFLTKESTVPTSNPRIINTTIA